MKKILFVVCTHGDELAGLDLFLKYPYGKNRHVEWKILVGNPEAALLNSRFFETDLNRSFAQTKPKSYEDMRALRLKTIMNSYDVVYDLHTTTEIRNSLEWNCCVFVNNLERKTLAECSYLNARYFIWDKDTTIPEQFLPYHAKTGITVEYVKTGNVQKDRKRMEKDFIKIINQKKVPSHKNVKRIFCQAYLPVSQDSRDKLGLKLREFKALTEKEKKLLKLDRNKEYYPVFVNSREIEPVNYCYLNIKLSVNE